MSPDDSAGEDLPRSVLKRLRVARIEVQPDRYKPIHGSKYLEVGRFKRARVTFHLTEDSSQSTLTGILDFRGRTFILSRVTGTCSVLEVMEALTDFFYEKYDKVGLENGEVGDADTVWECTVVNPNLFLGYLHVIKERKNGLGWIGYQSDASSEFSEDSSFL